MKLHDFKRKAKKAFRDPKWEVKRSRELLQEYKVNHRKMVFPKKYVGKEQYTVVSAVYNVSEYLDEYFTSLVNQTIKFENHIQLVLVDDGSTDNSAEIIKRWQSRYPNNITYVYKTNGGISSARNLGMRYVKTKWVTFIDSDDFVAPDYFQLIDEVISSDCETEMVVGNLYYYHDKTKVASNTHPLKYRFKDRVTNRYG